LKIQENFSDTNTLMHKVMYTKEKLENEGISTHWRHPGKGQLIFDNPQLFVILGVEKLYFPQENISFSSSEDLIIHRFFPINLFICCLRLPSA